MHFHFIDVAEDSSSKGYFHIYRSSDDLNVGIYPVLFGFRVRVWWTDSMDCVADLCCGDNSENVALVFRAVLNFLESGEMPETIPYQTKRPFPSGDKFSHWVTGVISKYPFPHRKVSITDQDLRSFKNIQMSSMQNNYVYELTRR